MLGRLAVASEAFQRHTDVVVDLGVPWRQADRLLEAAQRQLRLAEAQMGMSAALVSRQQVRLQRCGARIGPQRIGVATLLASALPRFVCITGLEGWILAAAWNSGRAFLGAAHRPNVMPKRCSAAALRGSRATNGRNRAAASGEPALAL